MCRWLAYSGDPISIAEVLYKPKHSLIDQSLRSRLGVETTNGDGFGIGWYGDSEIPAIFRSVEPAWSDRNLREISDHVSTRLLFAHIRASTGSAIQETNCHPFRYGRWLWMHNGLIRDFAKVKRDLAFAVEPSLYTAIEGATDSELFFYLALSMGLEKDPPEAVARATGLIEDVGHRRGVEHPIQMTIATSDGQRIWAFRYSSEGKSRSLFYSTLVETLQKQYPDNPTFQHLSHETRLIVSEPLGDLEGAWNEMPEASWGVVQEGSDELHSFEPRHGAARPVSARAGSA